MNNYFRYGCIALLLLASCNAEQASGPQNSHQNASLEAAANTDTTASEANGALPLNAPERKVIKTAAMRCRVHDVFAVTTRIEQLAQQLQGQVTSSIFHNDPTELETIPYKPDSLIRVQTYSTTANLTIRIPAEQLDTVLADIAVAAAFIHSRNLNLEDVTLQYLSTKLKVAASNHHSVSTLPVKRTDALQAAAYTRNKEEETIDRTIANKRIEEQSVYATVQLELYQPDRVDRQIVANTGQLMKPPFTTGLTAAFAGGWQLLLAALLFIVQLWPLLLGGFAAFLLVRKYSVKRKHPALVK